VHELGIRGDREAGDDRAQVDRQERRKGAGVAEHERQQAGYGKYRQPQQEKVVTGPHRRVRSGWIGAALEHQQSPAADGQPGAADHPEQHRRGQQRVRRRVAENVLAGRGGHGGSGAQQETAGDDVVQPAPPWGRIVARVGAVRAAAAQVPQRARLHGSRRESGERPPAAGVPPVPDGRPARHRDSPRDGQPGGGGQRGVGDDPVRRPGNAGGSRADQRADRQHRDRAAGGQRHRPGTPAAHARQVPVVGVTPDRGKDGGRVDRELVRRRVHTGRVAVAAVVAQVRKMDDVAFGERAAQFQRGEHRAVALAVAAGVADDELAFGLGEQAGQRDLSHRRPPRPRRPARPRRPPRPPTRRRSGPTRGRPSPRNRLDTQMTGYFLT
jgi:hypothetical protein